MQNSTLSNQQLHQVRAQVAAFLGRSAAFAKLPPAERAQALADTERIVAAMAEGGTRHVDPYANLHYDRALDMSVDPHGVSGLPSGQIGTTVSGGAKEMMDKSIGAAGSIIQTGVDQAARMIREIDFPLFVAKLIEGTFHAIVKSSIEQMKAYSEMVRSVSTSLNDFKERNTTENQAMDHLASRYPSLLQVQIDNGTPKVSVRDGADTDNLPDFQKDLGLSESISDLDDETIATKLVPAARDDLARGRQQLLATIILMGINRIVVTDGKINAKIKFQFSAKEKRQIKASAFDYAYMGNQVSSRHSSDPNTDTATQDYSSLQGLPPTTQSRILDQWQADSAANSANRYATGQDETDVTPDVRVTSEFDMSQEGAIQAAGQIMGEVSINFKSDVFPLERLADTDMIQKLQSAQGAGRGALPPTAPGASTPSSTSGTPSTAAPAGAPPAAAAAPSK